jgi:hypothetical protein
MAERAGEQSVYPAENNGERPAQPWHTDTRNRFYFGDAGADCLRPLTQQAKRMKENCFLYVLATETGKAAVSVRSPDASVACRVNRTPQEQLVLYVNNRWDYPEIAWGNYSKRLDPSLCYGRLTLCLQSEKGAGIEYGFADGYNSRMGVGIFIILSPNVFL